MKKSRLIGGVCACLISLCSYPVHSVAVSGQGTWETTLQGRDLDGNAATFEAYYDTVLDITWIADANLAASNTFGLPYATNLGDYPSDPYGPSYTELIRTDGSMSWGGALHWIDAMNAANYLGYSDWRMPTMMDTGAPGCDFAYNGTDCGFNVQTGSESTTVYSEMASLWYDTLGNLAIYDTSGNHNQPGWGLTNTGSFSNIQAAYYWTGLEYPNVNPWYAWYLSTEHGLQHWDQKVYSNYAFVVREGDISAIPIPASVWLFGSGLLGLIGTARGKKTPLR